MTIELYYWPTPNGWKITIALEELALPYQVKLVDISAGAQFTPEFLAIAPNNRIPAIIDSDGPDASPVSIFESGAILQYLARKAGALMGSNARERIAVEEWLMWQVGGVGPMAGQAYHFLSYAPAMEPPQNLPYAKDRYRNEVARLYGVLDKRLAQNRYVAGDFLSIADIAIWPWAQGWLSQQQTLDDKPHFARWLRELAQRPAFIAGKAVGADRRNTAARDDRLAQDILFFGKRP